MQEGGRERGGVVRTQTSAASLAAMRVRMKALVGIRTLPAVNHHAHFRELDINI